MDPSHPILFDYDAVVRARTRAKTIAGDRFLERLAQQSMADRLSVITQRFARGLWIGENVAPEILPFAETWECSDFDAEEVLTARGPFDLIVSLFSLQWINDLPGALLQIRRLLRPDGLFMAALFGGSTLSELRQSFVLAETATRGGISPRISAFADVRDLGSLLQRAGFGLPVADMERLCVRYSSILNLARDLRSHAMTNVMKQRSRAPLRRDTLAALLSHYASHYADDDAKMRANFETLYLTGWAPHENQQKPLTPGSAKTRLADALGTKEISVRAPRPRN
jgi:SAM-dependent methyltransferase